MGFVCGVLVLAATLALVLDWLHRRSFYLRLTDALDAVLREEEMYALVVDPAEGCDTGTPAAWAATNARMALEDPSQEAAFREALGPDGAASLG